LQNRDFIHSKQNSNKQREHHPFVIRVPATRLLTSNHLASTECSMTLLEVCACLTCHTPRAATSETTLAPAPCTRTAPNVRLPSFARVGCAPFEPFQIFVHPFQDYPSIA
jgi:hypothetical protein